MRTVIRAACFLAMALSLHGCASPSDVTIKIADAPVEVRQGQRFSFTCTVTNTAEKDQELVSLDVADEYLEGIVVVGTDPAFKEATHIPLDNTMSYGYNIPLVRGKPVNVVFDCYAAKPGDYSGEVDFCINNDSSFLSYPIRTIVK